MQRLLSWPFTISGRRMCGKLYIMLNPHGSPINLSPFSLISDHLKVWPLHKRSLTFCLSLPLSRHWSIVWIPWHWLFYSLWIVEEIELYFNLIDVFLGLNPILPLPLNFIFPISTTMALPPDLYFAVIPHLYIILDLYYTCFFFQKYLYYM